MKYFSFDQMGFFFFNLSCYITVLLCAMVYEASSKSRQELGNLAFENLVIDKLAIAFMIRDSVLPRTESVENGGPVAGVGANYAEIIVIRHGETEWNADGRIQVSFFLYFSGSVYLLLCLDSFYRVDEQKRRTSFWFMMLHSD